MSNEQKYVNVSICQSNIKSKKDVYFARVCKEGRVGENELLSILQKKVPCIDINTMRVGLEKLVDVILELAASGMDVDFFGLGTFSLSSVGKIEVESGLQSVLGEKDGADDRKEEAFLEGESFVASESGTKTYIEKDNANFDVSDFVKSKPKFALKFAPSIACKKALRNVQMNLAIKKKHCPSIEKIENVGPCVNGNDVGIIRVIGENLKIAGDEEVAGIYISAENGCEIKINREHILQNTPKMLLILLDHKLKSQEKYTLSIITQYSPVGGKSTTSILRSGSFQFVWKEKVKTVACNILERCAIVA